MQPCLTWVFRDKTFHGTEDEAEVWRQEVARSKHVLKHVNLQEYGISRVDLFGLTVFSVKNQPQLFSTIDDALDSLGLCLIVHIDGAIFIEPYLS